MNVRRWILGACLIAITTAWSGAQEKYPAPSEQTHFSAEAEGVDHPVLIPEQVLNALGKDETVRRAMQDADPPVQTPPSTWFSAAKVHLGSQAESDLIVLAEGRLRESNVVAFWVFRKTASGYELVLNAAAHDLEITNHRSNGYRDIEMVAMTAVQLHTVVYRFDGKRYVVRWEKTEPIK